MRKHLQKIGLMAVLPLMASAVVCADGLRSVVSGSSRSLVETVAEAWQDDATGLDRTLRAQYIRLNEDNRLTGEISAIEKGTGNIIGVGLIEVALVQQSIVVARTLTDAQGNFLTQPISPGSYTLCVSGVDGFLAYGIQVVNREDPGGETLPIPAGDNENAQLNGSNQFSLAGFTQDDSSVRITAAVIPPEFSALNRIMSDFVPPGLGVGMGSSGGSRINVSESAAAGGFQITLQEDGKLEGRIAPLTSEQDQPIRLREMNAFLLLEDEIYARTSIDDDGNFAFNDVEPNVYGFAAAGRDGFAALSFQAVEYVENLNSSHSSGEVIQQVSAIQDNQPGDLLQVAVCPPEDIPFLRNRLRELDSRREQPVFDEFGNLVQGTPDPGFGGGFGGSGGGAAGGGLNLGTIAEAGLGVWVISEIIDNLDDDDFNPRPVSPFFAQPVIPPNF